MVLFLIENELGKEFNKIIMDLNTTKLVFLNILHKSVSNNSRSGIFFYMEFYLCPMLGKVPCPLPLTENTFKTLIAARLCFVNELELILFA